MSDTLPAAAPEDMILAGSFDRCTFEEMLGMVAISRQCIEVVLTRGDEPRGNLLIKSGQLLSARTPQGDGLPAFEAIRQDPGEDFAMYQRPSVRWPAVTLGPLSQIMSSPQSAVVEGQLVMQGVLGPVTLNELLEIAALSRQQLEIAIANRNGRLGSLVVRANYLLRASECGGAEGLEAFHLLRRASGEHFLVLRQPVDSSLTPLTTISQLLNDSEQAANETPSLIMQGNFSEVPFQDVLGAFSLSRQLTELILSDSSGVRGVILVKAGHLLSARSMAHGNQGRQAFLDLMREPGTDIAAHARDETVRDAEAIGTLTELIEESRKPAKPPRPVRAPLMEGNFTTMPLQALMMMISRSRQVMEVAFIKGDDEIGTMTVKAGQLLGAATGGQAGLAAFQALIADPGTGFKVFRAPLGEAPTESLGALTNLLTNRTKVAPPPQREIVLKGRIEDGDLLEIFEILGMSRQLLDVEFLRGDEKLGSMALKSGQILGARAGSQEGHAALQTILNLSSADIAVYQGPASGTLPRPLGSLALLIEEHAPEVFVQPKPVPAPAPKPAPKPAAAAPAPKPAEPDPAAAAAAAELAALKEQLAKQSALIAQLQSQPAPAPAAGPSPELLALLQSLQQPSQSERTLMWIVGSAQVVMLLMVVALMAKVLV